MGGNPVLGIFLWVGGREAPNYVGGNHYEQGRLKCLQRMPQDESPVTSKLLKRPFSAQNLSEHLGPNFPPTQNHSGHLNARVLWTFPFSVPLNPIPCHHSGKHNWVV